MGVHDFILCASQLGRWYADGMHRAPRFQYFACVAHYYDRLLHDAMFLLGAADGKVCT